VLLVRSIFLNPPFPLGTARPHKYQLLSKD
jgi:hypothetical protein